MCKITKLNFINNRVPSTKQNHTIFIALIDRLKVILGKLLLKLQAPAIIADFEHVDELTGIKLIIRPQLLFTKITINNRDFYFKRFSGKFDGTGWGCGSC